MPDRPYSRTLRLDTGERDRLQYWSEKLGMSENDFLREAMEFYIAWRNHDVPVADLVVERTNEVVGHLVSLEDTVEGLSQTVSMLVRTITTIGQASSNRLSAPESGELHGPLTEEM